MSHAAEPIFAALEHEIAAEGRRFLHGLTSHFPHHGYHAPDAASASSITEVPVSILTEAVDGIKSGVDGVEGWLESLKPHVETIAAEAARIESNPATQAVVKAVEDAGLPVEWVNLVTDFIGKLGTLAATPAPAAGPAPVPGDTQPPAQDQPQAPAA